MHFQCLLHKVAVISGTKILLFPYLCCTMAKKPFIPIPPMAELPPAEEINAAELLDKYLSGEIDLICVLGPTASGKTRYAVRLARQINTILEDYAAIKPGDCGHRGPCHPRHGSGGTTSVAQWWGERSERPNYYTLNSKLVLPTCLFKTSLIARYNVHDTSVLWTLLVYNVHVLAILCT